MTANTTYETILREAQQLSDDEQRRLRDALTSTDDNRSDISATVLSLPPVGAFAAALQLSEPIRAEVLDAMERAIQEDFEANDSDD